MTDMTDSTGMTDTPNALGFLAALQLADSAFPSGGFALSHGLESLVQAGSVYDEATLTDAIRTMIVGQVGPADAVALVGAHRAARTGDHTTLWAVDCALLATKLARESRAASLRGGSRLLALAPQVTPSPIIARFGEAIRAGEARGMHPVVLGALLAALDVPEQGAALVFLHGIVTNLTGAALRLMRFDHEGAQRVRTALAPLLVMQANRACATHWREMASAAPLWEVAAMRHPYAETRLFLS